MGKFIEHKGLGKSYTLPDLKQKDADAWLRHVRALDPDWRFKASTELRSVYAKAAVRMGWYPDWTEQTLDDCAVPGLVAWLGQEADRHAAPFLIPPPNLNGSDSEPPTTPADS